jgi:hypothetical protein
MKEQLKMTTKHNYKRHKFMMGLLPGKAASTHSATNYTECNQSHSISARIQPP